MEEGFMSIERRNPRAEATALLLSGFEARVLEPSLPVNTDPVWFADDPTDPSGAGSIVTPVASEGATWSSLEDPAAREYAHRNWLDGLRRLAPLPPAFPATRAALHQLAFFAIAPKRFAANGKLGLRYTSGGFGTPFFGDDEQVRTEDGVLVHQTADGVRTMPVTTMAACASFLGLDYRPDWFAGFHDPLQPVDPDLPLEIDGPSATSLGDWFGFSTHVLELARRTPGAESVARVQLWPEHLDPAFEMGPDGRRASYGASAGDAGHPEPYLYVAAWGGVDRSDPYWNDDTFNGASLAYADLLTADDPYLAATSFFQAGHDRLVA
jgi:hypothetical protein